MWTVSKLPETFCLLFLESEKFNWVFQTVTNKFLDYYMLLNCSSLPTTEIHYANKRQATAGILLYQVLSMDKELLWFLWEAQPGSARHCQTVCLKGTVGKTDIFHYCFPSVKFDLFSYLVLATETNHALIYSPFFLVTQSFGKNTPNDLFSFTLAQLCWKAGVLSTALLSPSPLSHSLQVT